jgi:hypothetical protein
LELIASGKVNRAFALRSDEWYAGVIEAAKTVANEKANQRISDYLNDPEKRYSSSKLGGLVGTTIQITDVLEDEHLPTEDWLPTTVSPLVNNWLFRQGGSQLSTAWWARTDYFNQSLATLGGGDLAVKAGGAIRNVSASAATNAFMKGSGTNTAIIENGGGDLFMAAAGDIAGAAVYVQKGRAVVTTQETITSGDNLIDISDSKDTHTKLPGSTKDNRVPLGTFIAMGDAQISLTARKNLQIEAVYNPMMAEQNKYNRAGALVNSDLIAGLRNVDEVEGLKDLYPRFRNEAGFSPIYSELGLWNPSNPNSAKFQKNFSQFSTFSSYTDKSQINVFSLAGNVIQSNDSSALSRSGGVMVLNELVSGNGFSLLGFDRFYTTVPSQLKVIATGGGYLSPNGFTMLPSTNAQLNI